MDRNLSSKSEESFAKFNIIKFTRLQNLNGHISQKLSVMVNNDLEANGFLIKDATNNSSFVRIFKMRFQLSKFRKRYGPFVVKVYYLRYPDSKSNQEIQKKNLNKFNKLVDQEKRVNEKFLEDGLKSSNFVKQRVVTIETDEGDGSSDLYMVAMPFYSTFLHTLLESLTNIRMTCLLRQHIFLQLLQQLKTGRDNGYYYTDIKPNNIAVNISDQESHTIPLVARFADLNSVGLYSYRPLLFSHVPGKAKLSLANVFLWLIFSIATATIENKDNIFLRRLQYLLNRKSKLFCYPGETPGNSYVGISSTSMLSYLVNTLYNLVHPLFFSQSAGSSCLNEEKFCQMALKAAFTDVEHQSGHYNDFSPIVSASSFTQEEEVSGLTVNSFESLLLTLLSA